MRGFSLEGPNRPAAIAGLVAITGNVFGVVFLREIPSAYRLAMLDGWAAEVLLHPLAASASAVSFVIGLVALAVWAAELGRTIDSHLGRVGAQVITLGALLNAAGSVGPVIWATHVGRGAGSEELGRALLGASLTLDAAFNLALSIGLSGVAIGWPSTGWTGNKDGALRKLALGAGVLSLPVAAQAFFDPAALVLYLAAPLWLLFIAMTSVRAWGSYDRAR